MTVIDLDSPDLTWRQFSPAGADSPAQMSMLFADDARSVRTVLVAFDAGWQRMSTGNQPAAEEMVVIEGALHISGLVCTPEDFLIGEPHATRAETFSPHPSRAVVWFSGASGGWQEGPAAEPRSMRAVPLKAGQLRAPHPEMVGSVDFLDQVAGRRFDGDVDLLWVRERKFQHLPAGQVAADIDGPAVVRRWS